MSNTHFAKYRGLANSMTKNLKPTYMEKMIVREPQLKIKKPNILKNKNYELKQIEIKNAILLIDRNIIFIILPC